ncbi:hypothetical protein [Amycolatopsis azurea]|uniref:hypothetical protein n=1 Tax=Amycolatopsis azurea TaxID=36819 RepID=UPI0011778D6A|nr:hypothetical protein [Amycolatopsis azurea]
MPQLLAEHLVSGRLLLQRVSKLAHLRGILRSTFSGVENRGRVRIVGELGLDQLIQPGYRTSGTLTAPQFPGEHRGNPGADALTKGQRHNAGRGNPP